MALGLDSQVGFAVEGTPGTYETVTRFFEFVPPLGIRKNQTVVKSRGIRAGRRLAHAAVLGTSQVEGPMTIELTNNSVGMLLKAMIEGTPSTTGSNPYTHVYDFSTDVASLSCQVGLPSSSAVHPISYAGLRCRSWTLSCSPGDTFVTLTIDWIGKSADIDGTPSLESATYASSTRFLFTHCTFSVAGSEVCVDNFSITGTTGYEMEHKVCSTDLGTPALFRASKPMVTGSAVTDLASLTQLGRYFAGTQVAFALAINAGSSAQLNIAGNIYFTGDMATIEGEGKTKETVNFEFIHATSDASGFAATLINTDSTP